VRETGPDQVRVLDNRRLHLVDNMDETICFFFYEIEYNVRVNNGQKTLTGTVFCYSLVFILFKIHELTHHISHNLKYGHYLVEVRLVVTIKTSKAHSYVCKYSKINSHKYTTAKKK
jgi:hypothetical protein